VCGHRTLLAVLGVEQRQSGHRQASPRSHKCTQCSLSVHNCLAVGCSVSACLTCSKGGTHCMASLDCNVSCAYDIGYKSCYGESVIYQERVSIKF
jgi:hypothetical protein